ncbi:MAG: hypothetical protein R3323_02080, partial [Wenzhouxiangellaceae bacterium]|nr:hypothetical protein [Wenzhouxiangellaceae bacterium]
MRLINELRRRNVFRVAAAYLVVAWLVLQVGDVAADGLFLPDWFMPMLFVMLGLGLPIALVLSWAFEWTPEGIMRDADVSRPAGVLPASARSLDRLIVVALIAVIAVLAVERIWFAGKESRRAADFRDKSVAVLPFSNFSDDPANAYFADGIAEEILNLLAAVRELEVASRTSSFAFRDAETPLPRIADALEVRYLLEGSVRRAGDRVRITAQLIDAATDRHLWSRTFDRELDDIFAVQDEIAGAVGAALQVELLGRGGRLVSAEVVDPAAYERFLEARFLMRQRNAEALSRAEGMLESVVAAEPDFARALSLLA